MLWALWHLAHSWWSFRIYKMSLWLSSLLCSLVRMALAWQRPKRMMMFVSTGRLWPKYRRRAWFWRGHPPVNSNLCLRREQQCQSSLGLMVRNTVAERSNWDSAFCHQRRKGGQTSSGVCPSLSFLFATEQAPRPWRPWEYCEDVVGPYLRLSGYGFLVEANLISVLSCRSGILDLCPQSWTI